MGKRMSNSFVLSVKPKDGDDAEHYEIVTDDAVLRIEADGTVACHVSGRVLHYKGGAWTLANDTEIYRELLDENGDVISTDGYADRDKADYVTAGRFNLDGEFDGDLWSDHGMFAAIRISHGAAGTVDAVATIKVAEYVPGQLSVVTDSDCITVQADAHGNVSGVKDAGSSLPTTIQLYDGSKVVPYDRWNSVVVEYGGVVARLPHVGHFAGQGIYINTLTAGTTGVTAKYGFTAGVMSNGAMTITINAAIGGRNCIVKRQIPSIVTLRGAAGATGRMGRNYYYDGEWEAGKRYVADDFRAPYVHYTDQTGQYESGWFLLVGAASEEGWIPSSSAHGNATADTVSQTMVWAPMEDSFRYIVTEAVFVGLFAKFGAAIVNEDYLFSQYGRMMGYDGAYVDGVDQYQYIDSNDVEGADMDPVSADDPDILSFGYDADVGTAWGAVASVVLEEGRYYTIQVTAGASGSLSVCLGKTSASPLFGTLTFSGDDTTESRVFLCPESGTYSLFARAGDGSETVSEWHLRTAKFAPYLVMNLLTGEVVLNSLKARGTLYADSLYYDMTYENSTGVIPLGGASIVNLGSKAVDSTVRLPAPALAAGRQVEIFSAATRFYMTWDGAVRNSTFECAYGSGLGLSVTSPVSYKYVKLHSDGKNWWVLRCES